MNVNQIYQYLLFLIKKYQSGTVSATDFFYAWNTEQHTFMNELLGNLHNRNSTKTGNNTGLVMDRRTMTMLQPFTVPDGFTVVSGVINPMPIEILMLLSIRIGEKAVHEIHADQIFSVVGSVIDPPSEDDGKFYYYLGEDAIYILPNTFNGLADIIYISKPVDVVWGYTLDVDNRQVYNAGTSVQPLWAVGEIIEITKRTLSSLGVRFASQDFQNFGKTAIATGQ